MDKQRAQSRSSPTRRAIGTAHAPRRRDGAATGERRRARREEGQRASDSVVAYAGKRRINEIGHCIKRITKSGARAVSVDTHLDEEVQSSVLRLPLLYCPGQQILLLLGRLVCDLSGRSSPTVMKAIVSS